MENSSSPSAQHFYQLIPPSDAWGTYLYAKTLLVPAAVIQCFGKSDPSEDGKVSGQWAFRKDNLIFTLYDWKSTDLYLPGLGTPRELWESTEPFPLHVGSRVPATDEDALEFVDYLQKRTSEKSQS